MKKMLLLGLLVLGSSFISKSDDYIRTDCALLTVEYQGVFFTQPREIEFKW